MILEAWELPAAERAALLGLHCDLATRLPCYRMGTKPLPDDAEILERAGNLVAIHRALGRVFPADVNERYEWVRTPNARFCAGRTPLGVMLNSGLPGIRCVELAVESLLA
jgi:hypothetical protein